MRRSADARARRVDAARARPPHDRLRPAHRARPRGVEPLAVRRGATVLSVCGLRLRPDGAPIDVEIRARRARRPRRASRDTARTSSSTRCEEGPLERRGGLPPRRRRDDRDRRRAEAAEQGIAYVPRERRQALFAWMSIRENFAHADPRGKTPARLVRHPPRAGGFDGYVDQLEIVLGAPTTRSRR